MAGLSWGSCPNLAKVLGDRTVMEPQVNVTVKLGALAPDRDVSLRIFAASLSEVGFRMGYATDVSVGAQKGARKVLARFLTQCSLAKAALGEQGPLAQEILRLILVDSFWSKLNPEERLGALYVLVNPSGFSTKLQSLREELSGAAPAAASLSAEDLGL